MYVEDKLTRKTTFNMDDYSGTHNSGDEARLHPMHHELVIKSRDGSIYTIAVLQLEVFLSYASQHNSMGAALDAVAAAIPQKKVA